VKRSFRSKFELELSETSLGYSKLSELLNSDCFKGICAVELQEYGYVVVGTTPEASSMTCNDFASSCIDQEAFDEPRLKKYDGDDIHTSVAQTSSGCCLEAGQLVGHSLTGIAPLVQRTFIQFDLPRTSELGSRHRSSSVPKDMEFGQSWCDVTEYVEKFGGRASRQSTAASSCCAGDITPPSSSSDLDQNDSEEEQGYEAPSGQLMMPSMSSWVDEPLQLEDEDEITDIVPEDDLNSIRRKWQSLTPYVLAKEGYKVQNTFFHIAPQLPTPVRTGAVHRSKSVPKEFKGAISELQCMRDQRPPSYTSPSMKSSPLTSPSVYWPSTPAEPDFSQGSFSWASARCEALEPPILAPTCQFLQPLVPVAPCHSILYLTQYV
jgi:hypothetical protein